MSINANRLVSITPRVISGGSADLETNGLILTANTSIQGNLTPLRKSGNFSDSVHLNTSPHNSTLPVLTISQKPLQPYGSVEF